jgi:pseudouridine-5'-phosphate glycosidase
MISIAKSSVFALEVTRAQTQGLAMVALESAVITHGLARPQNLTLALDMEQAVRAEGATPATVGVLEGKMIVGLDQAELERLAYADSPLKISLRNIAAALVKQASGGTTVAGTMFAANRAGIKVLAGGGIGGVHVEQRFDVSPDLRALAEIPMIVVCAGAKSILDLPATVEYLEGMDVPVIGYQTDKFPEFFSVGKGLPVSARLDTTEEIAKFAFYHWGLGAKTAILVCQPLPSSAALDPKEADEAQRKASQEAQQQGVRGQKLTPFLLKRVGQLTSGKSTRAHLALLVNNAKLAAQVSRALVDLQRSQKMI